jgi:sulfur-carrier protein
MATVHIPSLLRDVTQGQDTITLPAATVRRLIEGLDERFPGFKERICAGDSIRPSIAVWVDGEVTRQGMIQPLGEASEVHFLPAIGGG